MDAKGPRYCPSIEDKIVRWVLTDWVLRGPLCVLPQVGVWLRVWFGGSGPRAWRSADGGAMGCVDGWSLSLGGWGAWGGQAEFWAWNPL